ncbi:hypothetical protein Agabi119p4_9119 [Agaricus bisporus var. burnettii]|uniref:Uncharacterized protein n=1 Tax=Agaricus bisporus var. burnettii TaxID=192524 RepID=A0A8H7C508_AGABI|nr:hypothetical protein Agabi119p4_9119 [Agaricus bisporus var. burnettii]
MWPFSSTPYSKIAFDSSTQMRLYHCWWWNCGICSGEPIERRARDYSADTWLSRIPLHSMSYGSEGAFCRLQKSEDQPELNKDFRLICRSGLGGSFVSAACSIPRVRQKNMISLTKVDEIGNLLDREDEDSVRGEDWRDPLYSPTFSRLIEARKSLGILHSEDLSSPKNPTSCIGRGQFTQDREQYRNSTNRAFFSAELVLERKNLPIVTNAIGRGLIIEARCYTVSVSSFPTV